MGRNRGQGSHALLATAVASAVSAIVVSACTDSTPAGCTGTCAAGERIPHCIATGGCVRSSDCPAGLSCLPPLVDPRPAPPSCGPLPSFGGAGSRVCRLARAEDATGDALVKQFGGALIDLEAARSEGSRAFSFQAPAGVRVVSCALFACAPEIEDVARGDTVASEIVDFDQCVVAGATFDSAQGAFDLGSPLLAQSKPPLDSAGACGARTVARDVPWVVTLLEIGCWGYDDTHIAAASLLVPVIAADVNYPDLVVADCADKPGFSCLLPDGTFGTCDDVCRARCVDPHDCLPPPSSIPARDAGVTADGGQDAATSWACKGTSSFAPGVCVPASECGGGAP